MKMPRIRTFGAVAGCPLPRQTRRASRVPSAPLFDRHREGNLKAQFCQIQSEGAPAGLSAVCERVRRFLDRRRPASGAAKVGNQSGQGTVPTRSRVRWPGTALTARSTGIDCESSRRGDGSEPEPGWPESGDGVNAGGAELQRHLLCAWRSTDQQATEFWETAIYLLLWFCALFAIVKSLLPELIRATIVGIIQR